ncbi:hypothetical protein [Krasilnikovia sp. MM14-A1259]|uniref:hypothetical protein n=1 Tax=Krasilnikovia sp. MM14-A1259 TaxID=3373539 RepID=UPI00399D14EF
MHITLVVGSPWERWILIAALVVAVASSIGVEAAEVLRSRRRPPRSPGLPHPANRAAAAAGADRRAKRRVRQLQHGAHVGAAPRR